MQENHIQPDSHAGVLFHDDWRAVLGDTAVSHGVLRRKIMAVVSGTASDKANSAEFCIAKAFGAANNPGPSRDEEFAEALPTDDEPQVLSAALKETPACRRRVLIVEDNRDCALSLSVLLQLMGHEVRLAYTGPEAVALAAEWPPEITISDIGLPGFDGFEVARQLRGQFGSTLLLVALTGYGGDDYRRRSQMAGFDHHLVKPADPAVLQQMLTTPR
jgi:CheY-like chemotaxis protein